MTRGIGFFVALLVSVGLTACQPDEPDLGLPDTAPPAVSPDTAPLGAPAALPNWYRIDGNRVELDIVAGATPDGQHWNFNGGRNGDMVITVPVGAEVTIRFRNDDPVTPHSIGVAPFTSTPPSDPPAESVFRGALSSNPKSMTNSTLPGESESITFTADEEGEYSLLCYIPGHGVTGMWVRFNVGQEASVTGAPNIEIARQ